MAAIDKVRIIVVGDSGVGKTSLVHLICHNEPIGEPSWTIGCSVEVKIHDYKAGTPSEKPYFVELWDIGGWQSHKNSRGVFYNPVHGIILVHDLTNWKSQQNLKKWLTEVLSKANNEDDFDFDPEEVADMSIPILVVGTKLDEAESTRDTSTKRTFSIAQQCRADEINLDCNQVKHLSPGSSNAVKLSRFFDKVVQRKYYARENTQPTSMLYQTDRRRPLSQYTKSLHQD